MAWERPGAGCSPASGAFACDRMRGWQSGHCDLVDRRVEEVANMVVYVASPLASATTGAALRLDGGVVDSLV